MTFDDEAGGTADAGLLVADGGALSSNDRFED